MTENYGDKSTSFKEGSREERAGSHKYTMQEVAGERKWRVCGLLVLDPLVGKIFTEEETWAMGWTIYSQQDWPQPRTVSLHQLGNFLIEEDKRTEYINKLYR